MNRSKRNNWEALQTTDPWNIDLAHFWDKLSARSQVEFPQQNYPDAADVWHTRFTSISRRPNGTCRRRLQQERMAAVDFDFNLINPIVRAG